MSTTHALLPILATLLGAPGCHRAAPVDSGEGPSLIQEEPPVIHMALVTHNEADTDRYGGYDNDDGYNEFRDQLLAIADLVVAHGATWEVQVDWLFLQAVALRDDGAGTDGQNILAWLAAQPGVQIDPHTHPDDTDGYSYADVACLIRELGVEPSGVVGGFLYEVEEGEPTWDNFWEPVQGEVLPDCTWEPTLLWGGATLRHQGEDEHLSGMWRPRSTGDFFEHDPAAPLPYLAGGGADFRPDEDESYAEGLARLVAAQAAGELQPEGFYASTPYYPEAALLTGDGVELADVERLLEEVDGYVAEGRVQWSTFDAMLEIWRDEHGEEPTQHDPFGEAIAGVAPARG